MDVGKSFADVAKELEEAYLYIYQLNDELKAQSNDKDDLQKQLDELKVQLTQLSEQSNK